MSRSITTVALTVIAGPLLTFTLLAAPAGATPQVGTCTSSYAPYTFDQLAFDPDAQAIFSTIDTNGDGIICFKPYPNGDHNGHLGNLVDNKAAPHT